MHARIRSTLIFAAALSLAATDAIAADAQSGAMLQPFPVGQAATAQPDGTQPSLATGQQNAAQPAVQTAQSTGAPATLQAPAPAADSGSAADSGITDDEEAPAPDTPDAAQVPPADQSQPEKQASGPKTPTDKIVDHFMELDTDGSKSVSMQEYVDMVQKRMEARFAAMDANHDGQITADEYRQFWKSRMAHWYRLNR